MVRSLEKLVALTVYANAYIKGRNLDLNLDNLLDDNLYSIEFLDPLPEGMAGTAVVIAASAEGWFKQLVVERAESVKLHNYPSDDLALPEHISAAFIGGGSLWLLEVLWKKSSDIYVDTQSTSAKTRFERVRKRRTPLRSTGPDVKTARETLDAVLKEMSEFTSRHEHSLHWVENFDRSRDIIHHNQPHMANLFLPPGTVTTEARRLIEAAFSSWVFGGMGSWNDMAFAGADNDKYVELTAKLYRAVCQALVAGANSGT